MEAEELALEACHILEDVDNYTEFDQGWALGVLHRKDNQAVNHDGAFGQGYEVGWTRMDKCLESSLVNA